MVRNICKHMLMYLFISLSLSVPFSFSLYLRVCYSNHVFINSSDSASLNRFWYYIKFLLLYYSQKLLNCWLYCENVMWGNSKCCIRGRPAIFSESFEWHFCFLGAKTETEKTCVINRTKFKKMCAKWNIKYGQLILIRRIDAVDWNLLSFHRF